MTQSLSPKSCVGGPPKVTDTLKLLVTVSPRPQSLGSSIRPRRRLTDVATRSVKGTGPESKTQTFYLTTDPSRGPSPELSKDSIRDFYRGFLGNVEGRYLHRRPHAPGDVLLNLTSVPERVISPTDPAIPMDPPGDTRHSKTPPPHPQSRSDPIEVTVVPMSEDPYSDQGR